MHKKYHIYVFLGVYMNIFEEHVEACVLPSYSLVELNGGERYHKREKGGRGFVIF